VARGSGGATTAGSGGATTAGSGGAVGTGGRVTAGSGGAVGTGGRATTGSGGGTGRGTGGTVSPGTGGAGGPVSLDGKRALVIVESPGSLDDGEVELKLQLELKGMTVTMGPPTGPASMATGQHVILVASGDASDIVPVFGTSTVPMIVFGNSYYQMMGLVPNASSNRGSVDSSVKTTIVDGASPLAGGIASGTDIDIILPTRDSDLHWGIPAGSPVRVAAVMGMTTQFIVFGFEKGAAMATGNAPARRVAIGFRSNVIKDLTIPGFTLLIAAVQWTAGAP
jgi:hypothetical protein